MKFRQIKNCLLSPAYLTVHRLGCRPLGITPSKVRWGLNLHLQAHTKAVPAPRLWGERARLHMDTAPLDPSLTFTLTLHLSSGIQECQAPAGLLDQVYRSCQEILAHQKATSASPWVPALRKPVLLQQRLLSHSGWLIFCILNLQVDIVWETSMDVVDLRAPEKVTGNLTYCVILSKVLMYILVFLLYCFWFIFTNWGETLKLYVRSNVD